MILVDSSVWIDYFAGVDSRPAGTLDGLLGDTPVCIGDLILTEVLQGIREDKEFNQVKRFFEPLTVYNLLGRQIALQSAKNFRNLRKRGITVRKTADVVIATFCIERKLPLLFSDRDFKPFVKHLGLVAA